MRSRLSPDYPALPYSRFFLSAAAAALLVLTGSTATFAKDKPAPDAGVAPAKEMSVGQSAARARQKKCGAEWRGLSATEKTAQGPTWPKYYSKCVKRLKEQKA